MPKDSAACVAASGRSRLAIHKIGSLFLALLCAAILAACSAPASSNSTATPVQSTLAVTPQPASAVTLQPTPTPQPPSALGYSVPIPLEWKPLLSNAWGSLLATIIAWALIALLTYVLLTYGLRILSRQSSTQVDDVVIAIIRKPLFVLIVVFGTLNSLEVLGLPAGIIRVIEDISNSALIVIVAYLVIRIIKDVVVHFGESWAQRTESRVDDVLIPIVNLFGPFVVAIVALGMLLRAWGFDITSVLVGAGVVGLVLGLALQDTLSNVFSGINLLIDSPFRTGDLIVLADGKLCEVERIGVRATQLYYLLEHSTVYMPNKELANSMVVNITRPTADLRVTIDISVLPLADFDQIRPLLRLIANEHPFVLGDLPTKIDALRAKMIRAQSDADKEYMSRVVARFQKEHTLNLLVQDLATDLNQMIPFLKTAERGGWTASELSELNRVYAVPIDERIQKTVQASQEWLELTISWAYPEEMASYLDGWQKRNEHLAARWNRLKKEMAHPSPDSEMQLPDLTDALARWIRSDYKWPVEPWKWPDVLFKGFGQFTADLQVDMYIDDIRLEHYERRQRVVRDISEEISRRFKAEGIEIPNPQQDLWFRNELAAKK